MIALLVVALLGVPGVAAAEEDVAETPVVQVVEAGPSAGSDAPVEGEPAPAPDPLPEPDPVPEPEPECMVTAATAGTKAVGSGTNMWGSLTHCDVTAVSVQSMESGAWVTFGQGTASGTGFYAIALSRNSDKAGTQTFRAVVRESDGSQHASPAVTLTRIATVGVSSAGSKQVGLATNAWGRVAGVANSTVWTEVYLSAGWSRSQVSRADGTGWYVLPLTYGVNTAGRFRYRIGATTPTGTVYSRDFMLTRTAVVSASSAGNKAVGLATNAWGRVAGAPSATVWTEVYLSGGWSRSQVSRADSTGWYTLPLTYGINTVGTYRYRVGASTATGTVYSPTFSLTRTSAAFRMDARCATGRAFCASKDQRKMAWVVDGEIIEIVDVRFGAPEYPTRNGAWEIYWKNADHVSSIYNVDMPYSMFFSGGQAIHYSADFNRVGYVGGSHGCINVGSMAAAARLFNAAKVGDKVIVYN